MSDCLLLLWYSPVSVSTLAMRGREISTIILSLLSTHIQTYVMVWTGGNAVFGFLLYFNTNTVSKALYLTQTHTVRCFKGQVIVSNGNMSASGDFDGGTCKCKAVCHRFLFYHFTPLCFTLLYFPHLFTTFSENLEGRQWELRPSPYNRLNWSALDNPKRTLGQ